MVAVDLNADVGEGAGNDKDLMPFLSSCNIACGGHAGDIKSIEETIIAAKKFDVKIGAHPSFPDRDNFGRLLMPIAPKHLRASLIEQIEHIETVACRLEVPVHHIKPHGALYNEVVKNKDLAALMLEVISSFKAPYKLYAPYKSVIAQMALEQEISVVYEAFADRNYNDDLSLVARTLNNAIIYNKYEILEHVKQIALKQKVKTIQQNAIEIKAETYCIHGDHPSAIEIASFLFTHLPNCGIKLK